MAWFLPVLEYSVVGVCSSSALCPGMWQALMARCSRPVVGFMDVRVVGLCVLLAGFFSACSSPMSEELGVRPRPMYLQCSPLLRLV